MVLAFFFLSWVGKHASSSTCTTRTTQIRRKDLQFWHKFPNGLMDRISPMATPANVLEADAATITPGNQKNGQRDAVLHDDAVLHNDALPNNPTFQCKTATRRFIRIRLCAPTNANAILSLCDPNKHDLATQMAGVMHVAALRSMVWLQGCDLLQISPRSLRVLPAPCN